MITMAMLKEFVSKIEHEDITAALAESDKIREQCPSIRYIGAGFFSGGMVVHFRDRDMNIFKTVEFNPN